MYNIFFIATSDRSMIINEKDCIVHPGQDKSLTPLTDPIKIFKCTVSLIKLLGNIITFLNLVKSRVSKTDPFAPSLSSPPKVETSHSSPLLTSPQFENLDTLLSEWKETLLILIPPSKDLTPEQFENVEVPEDLVWSKCYIWILYYTCVVLLHRPKMMQTEQNGDSWRKCKEAVLGVSDLIEKVGVVGKNECFFGLSQFTGFCIFQVTTRK